MTILDDVGSWLSDLSRWLASFREWVLAWAPASVANWTSQLPAYAQVLLLYVAILPLILGAVYIARKVASSGLRFAALLIKMVANQLPSDLFSGPITAFVWLDAASRAVSPTAYDRKMYFWAENPQIGNNGPPRQLYKPSLMIPLVYAFRIMTIVAGLFVVNMLALVAIAGRSLVRPRLVNLLALVIAVGASKLAGSAAALVTGASIINLPLGAIVAAGSLFALIYVLANSDVRGRAEFNKNASVQCRSVLHRNVSSMLTVANTLADLRLAGMGKLRRFPTAFEVGQLASRKDLCLRGGRIFPAEAEFFRHALRTRFPFNQKEFQEMVLESVRPCQPLSWHKSSRLYSDTVAESAKFVAEAAREMESQIQNLYLDGVSKRLDRVLGMIGGGLMSALRDDRFGANSAEEIQKLGSAEWLTHLLDTSQVEAIRAAWVNLESVHPDSPLLRSECYALTKTLRHVLCNIYFVYWDIAVAENRLRYLSARIDKSLEPPFLERIRQHFGK